ncbi:Uncharacterized protein dnm_024650 [Desulfonema magnum]|uniref:Uncharacterized protein n=1 Tax=Desulfonema magnum TaxID=45655 RepID=A0A975GM18_9BACT|nr:Uncharacterized protein dnm_024650 [Desulfonema magnum]
MIRFADRVRTEKKLIIEFKKKISGRNAKSALYFSPNFYR